MISSGSRVTPPIYDEHRNHMGCFCADGSKSFEVGYESAEVPVFELPVHLQVDEFQKNKTEDVCDWRSEVGGFCLLPNGLTTS